MLRCADVAQGSGCWHCFSTFQLGTLVLRCALVAQGRSSAQEAKRQFLTLIGKTNEADEAPEVTGQDVAEWVKNDSRLRKVQGAIQDINVCPGTKQDSFFAVIGFLAIDSTPLRITCWKDNLMHQFLGSSMKAQCFLVEEDDLLSTDRMTELLNKCQGLVSFAVKNPYKDG